MSIESENTQNRRPEYNHEPGIIPIPGSPFMREVAKFEQSDTKWTSREHGCPPGNPYTYRPYPKMLYRAYREGGSPACLSAPPDPSEFGGKSDALRAAEEKAKRFNERCTLIVQDDTQHRRAAEDGWMEDPKSAVEWLIAKDKKLVLDAAHTEYEDRGMSDVAKRERAEALEANGGDPMPEIPEKRRGRPRKTA